MEVILSLLPPGTVIQGVQPASTSFTAGPPSILAGMPAGTLVRGFVLNRDARGNAILRTEGGDLLLQSKFFLKIGSDVVLRLESSGRNVRANLLTVDGLAPEQAEARPAHAADEDVVQRAGEPRTASPARPPENDATATAVRTAAAPPRPTPPEAGTLQGTLARPPSADQPAPQHATVALRIVHVTQPLPSASSSAPPPSSGQAAGATATASPPPAANAPPDTDKTSAATPGYAIYTKRSSEGAPPLPPNALPAATPAQLKTSPQSTSAQSPPSSARPGAEVIEATVARLDATGKPILDTPLGPIRLHAPLPLSPGAALKLEILSLTPGTAASAPVSALPTLAGGWETLQHLAQLLRALDPDASDALLRRLSPGPLPALGQPTPAFTEEGLSASLFFFLTALKSGNMRSFLGERAAALLEAHGHSTLLAKAEGEFATLRSYFAEAAPQQWQALFLPIVVEGEAKMLRFYTKRERRQKADRDPVAGDTRFVVEMEMSALGPLQLDGLVKKQPEHGTQFDLIIRSRAYFGAEAENVIRGIFSSIGEATGYQGMLMFQLVDDFPVKPLEEIMTGTHRDVTV